MRKYLFSGKMWTSGFAVIGLVRSTVKAPRDWRTALLWVVWGSKLATAVGTVQINAKRAAAEDD